MKIKVLIITPQLGIGGAENQVVNLAKNLKLIDVTPMILSSRGFHIDELVREGVECYLAPMSRKDPYHALINIIAIRRILISSKIDVIHCHAALPTIFAKLASLGLKKPLVCTGHGWSTKRIPIIARVLKATNCHFIAISTDMSNQFIRYGFPSKRISLINNSIDPTKYNKTTNPSLRNELGASSDQILIGIIARISERLKGHSILFNAFSKLIKEFPHIRLVVVGDGSLRSKYEVEVAMLGLSEFVKFTGFRYDVPDILGALDIVVLPSLREGMPVVVLEAMAAGKPVVATSVNGTSELIIDRETGVLVEPNNVTSLLNGIRELILDKSKAEEIAKAGKKYVSEHYSLNNMAIAVKEVYVSLLEDIK